MDRKAFSGYVPNVGKWELPKSPPVSVERTDRKASFGAVQLSVSLVSCVFKAPSVIGIVSPGSQFMSTYSFLLFSRRQVCADGSGNRNFSSCHISVN